MLHPFNNNKKKCIVKILIIQRSNANTNLNEKVTKTAANRNIEC